MILLLLPVLSKKKQQKNQKQKNYQAPAWELDTERL